WRHDGAADRLPVCRRQSRRDAVAVVAAADPAGDLPRFRYRRGDGVRRFVERQHRLRDREVGQHDAGRHRHRRLYRAADRGRRFSASRLAWRCCAFMSWPSTGCCGGGFTILRKNDCGSTDMDQAIITTNGPLIAAEKISKTYQAPDHAGRLVLDRIDFGLKEGEIVAILGKSGSGKSTFLRVLAGLTPASEGRVVYRGHEVHEPVTGIAMVFQTFALFPWLTVLGNVELGLEAMGVPRAERRERALKAIDVIGLDGFESAYP